jgi:hypothetical protein
MCGIVGVFSRRGLVSPEVLERATQSLYHRGPDGQRQWISSDGKVGLGHARLAGPRGRDESILPGLHAQFMFLVFARKDDCHRPRMNATLRKLRCRNEQRITVA